jgi:hypothetical protein
MRIEVRDAQGREVPGSTGFSFVTRQDDRSWRAMPERIEQLCQQWIDAADARDVAAAAALRTNGTRRYQGLEAVLDAAPQGKRAGWHVHVSAGQDAEPIGPAASKPITAGFLEALTADLAQPFDGQNALSAAIVADTIDDSVPTAPSLTTLVPLPLDDLIAMGDVDAGFIGQADERLELGLDSYYGLRDSTPYRPTPQWQQLMIGRTNTWVVWIPETFPLLFVDAVPSGPAQAGDAEGAWYIHNGDAEWRQRDRPDNEVLVYAERAASNQARTVRSYDIRLARSGGGGGGGAMRCDAEGETDYGWDGPQELGYALGLDLARHRSQVRQWRWESSDLAPTPAASNRSFGESLTTGRLMDSEITYWKEPVADPPKRKDGRRRKNRPRGYHPYPPKWFQDKKSFKDKSPGGGVYEKKRKGQWALLMSGELARTGEGLTGSAGDRQSAGAVMERGLAAAGLADKARSATGFVRWLLETDAGDEQLQQHWAYSQTNRAIVPAADEDLKAEAALRTDQEWCHLHGHGDGGTETVDNFVAGSKHCNTEQLAIEMGQRAGGVNKLSIRVTAYLFPNDGVAKKVFTDADVALLRDFDFSSLSRQYKDSLSGDATAIDTGIKQQVQDAAHDLPRSLYRVVVDLLNRPPEQFAMVLPTAPQSKAPKVPLRQEFLDATNRQDVQKELLFYLVHAAHLSYPVARVIRYKIYRDGRKVFDHAFDGQRESIDYNEFRILMHTVRRVIATDAGGDTFDELSEEINAKIGARLAGDRRTLGLNDPQATRAAALPAYEPPGGQPQPQQPTQPQPRDLKRKLFGNTTNS